MVKKILFVLLTFCTISAYGQSAEVRGTVYNSSNETLPGVSVSIKGTTVGTYTDVDGTYSIRVSEGQTLSFSFVGTVPQEIVYAGQTTLNVTLLPDAESLLGEVVVIGYQTIRKADLTGAVSTFSPNLMKNTTVSGTVGDALGTLPGLMVRTAGQPGAEGKVEIRGLGTLGNSAPLYVVDGVISGANRDFNFNDIESIQVLKDASAAAIYGSRAGNGVIIITTKQGKEGKMKIELSSRVTMQWLPRYDLANRAQWIELNDLAVINAGQATKNHFDANTDWQNEVFKTGILQDHNIAFSGGSTDSRYFISGNYQHNSGSTIGTKSERFTLRANTSSSRSFGDNVIFRIGENMALSHFGVDELNTNPMYDVFRMLPTIPIYDPDNFGGYGFGNGSRDVTFGTNPFAREDFEDTRNSNLRIRGNAFSELELFKVLKYKFNFGFDFSNDKHKYLRKEGNWTYNQPIDPSSLNKNQAQSQSLVFDNTLEFNKSFDKHNVSAVAGISYQTSNYEQVWGTKNDVLSSNGIYFEQLDAALTNPKTGGFKDMEKLFSIFGRLNYNFDEKYLFSFTIRRDESSKFNPEHRVGYFPSVSGGWRISNESFFDVPWIDDLKIRANYGVLGTSNIGVWDWVPFVNIFPQVIFGNQLHTGMTQVKLANSDLKWEEMKQMNIGFDATILNSRLNISADYFIKNTDDILTPMKILMITGNNGGDPQVNAASIKNSGFELSATWRDKIGRDFNYNIGLNVSYIKNEVKSLGYDFDILGGYNEWDTKSMKGKPIGEWYLIKTDGIFKSASEVLAHTNSQGVVVQPNAQPGDIRYMDFNDDGRITDDDRQHCGSNLPKFHLGANLGFEYKGIDLQVVFQGSFGHKIFNGPRSAYDRFDDNSNYRADYDAWTPSNPNAKDPRPLYADSRNAFGNQDRWLEPGGYLKIKQIALGYNLPQSLLGNVFNQVRIYVNAQNLVTFTKYTGLDPEFLNRALWDRSYDPGAFPNPKGFTFGAQITF